MGSSRSQLGRDDDQGHQQHGEQAEQQERAVLVATAHVMTVPAPPGAPVPVAPGPVLTQRAGTAPLR
ncbi:hypothetical protein GCM10023225_06950 [Kineococcus glutinatus]|uniref:Uncharacterized protein n=1 Tax=Kineococcus glutinatus TaxID=1070872 RepID=A0ABP9HBR1_9ACTN